MDTAQPDAMGTVVAIWRYPVKSMMGEELNAVDVTLRGVAGDRACLSAARPIIRMRSVTRATSPCT